MAATSRGHSHERRRTCASGTRWRGSRARQRARARRPAPRTSARSGPDKRQRRWRHPPSRAARQASRRAPACRARRTAQDGPKSLHRPSRPPSRVRPHRVEQHAQTAGIDERPIIEVTMTSAAAAWARDITGPPAGGRRAERECWRRRSHARRSCPERQVAQVEHDQRHLHPRGAMAAVRRRAGERRRHGIRATGDRVRENQRTVHVDLRGWVNPQKSDHAAGAPCWPTAQWMPSTTHGTPPVKQQHPGRGVSSRVARPSPAIAMHN